MLFFIFWNIVLFQFLSKECLLKRLQHMAHNYVQFVLGNKAYYRHIFAMLVARNMKQLAYTWLQFPVPLSYFSPYRIFISTGDFFFILRICHLFFFFQNRKKYIFTDFFIFILSSDITMLAFLILKQGLQGLLAFAFSILTVNDENTKQP